MVKVQVPFQPGSNPQCMVYDCRRTFGNQFFNPMQHGAAGDKLVQLIRSRGEAGGMKGYFKARRDGTNIRIFADKICPAADW